MTTLPSRRVMIAAAAWSTPVVLLTAATPARATSTGGRSAVALGRALLYPDEATSVRVTRVDDTGRPLAGEPVWLSLSGPARAVVAQASGVTDAQGVFETSLRVATDAAPATGTLTVSSSGSVATSPLEVRKTAVVMHDATGATTTVLALPHGSQDAVRDSENRGYAHSDLQPTGRWVRTNETLGVDVKDGPASGLSLSFGARGPWRAFNNGQNVDVATVALTSGRQQVTAPRDGIVFVANSSTEQVATIVLSGGHAQPVWVKDSTTPDEFASQMSDFSTAPSVSLVGERTFVDVQRRLADDLVARGVSWDPADVVMRLDRVLAYTCDVHGLTYSAAGIARKHPGRVYFSGADSGAGWAFATNQWVCFQIDTGASETLLTTPDTWGVWHEVGHTFQTPSYTWGGLGEVTVNISSLALQQRLTGEHRLDEWPEMKDRVRQFLAQPIADRQYRRLNDESVFLGLFLFDQLRQSFGETFYPAVDQVYRVRRGQGKGMPSTDQEKMDMFAQVTSQVANRNLAPFFAQWGVPLSASVISSLQAYPPLTFDIWSAVDSRDAHREREVGYNLPLGSFAISPRGLDLGDASSADGDVSGLTSLSGAPSHVVSRGSSALNVGPAEGRLFVVIESDDATQELLTQTTAVTVTSALEFVGIYDIRSGWVGVSRDGTHVVATSTGVAPHDYYFKGKLYYQLTLLDAAGQTVVSVTVKGDETHDKVVQAMNGVGCVDGYRLRIRSAEPSRVRTWSNSQRVGELRFSTQTLFIRAGRLAFS